MNIDSTLCSLADLVAERPVWHFNVPIYQRLYVWGDDQVLTLLNDIVNAYERGEDLFFLGGTLLVEQPGGPGRRFDLIDGQQRFTTLWMLCHAWKRALEPFITAKSREVPEPRLAFAIRPEVNRLLEAMAFGSGEGGDGDEEGTRRMRNALDLMHSLFEKRPLPTSVSDHAAYHSGLTEFVFRKVRFVVTTVPREADLNKLFEVINNRGVQLQHHEILKARMLDALTEAERGSYAVLWDACADMENFVERSLSGLSGLPAHEVCAIYERGELTSARRVREALHRRGQEGESHLSLGLAEILQAADATTAPAAVSQPQAEEPMWIRSIFGFPLFLQHALRVWLFEAGRPDLPRLLDRELLTLFEAHFFGDPAELAQHVRSFIDLLWRLRVLFDEHVIKWADQGEDEVHLISKISVSTSNGRHYINRSSDTDADPAFSLLQSMLYHSQEITTQYWLTPLLLFIHRSPGSAALYLDYLRHLDNHLLGSKVDEALVVRTRSFMEEPWQRRELIHRKALAEPSGVKFAHYWFYKLEFVLWFEKARGTEGWKRFRMTAKSSVEHVSPQTPTDAEDERVHKALDHFGNLALVARSLNSEYSNRPYKVKRQQFLHKNKERMDSLKMDLIYEHERWTDQEAFVHQQAMIDAIDTYCANTPPGAT